MNDTLLKKQPTFPRTFYLKYATRTLFRATNAQTHIYKKQQQESMLN